jgi:hypothetical protein
MPCVWVKAWEGSRTMADGDKILTPQPAIDHRLKGRSSWLKVMRDRLPAPPPPAKPAAKAPVKEGAK